jgi:hypothetical protein
MVAKETVTHPAHSAADSEIATVPDDFHRDLQIGIEEALTGKGISARESLARLGVELDEDDDLNLDLDEEAAR